MSDTTIHRLLDEAFAGVTMTGELQDLKEELRGNLLARAAEHEAQGATPAEAARTALSELGDIRALIAEEPTGDRPMADHWRNRVRPKPAFVVRTVVLCIVGAAGVGKLALGLTGLLSMPTWLLLLGGMLTAVVFGVVTADALQQETSTNHPMPRRRAIGFGAGTALVLAGAAGSLIVLARLNLPWLGVGGAALVGGIALLSYLGATQTNRHKAWIMQAQQGTAEIGDRFSEDPAAAARFGIYTVVIWALTAVALVVLGFTVGWGWALLSLVGGFVAMMLVLARMLFGAKA